MLLTYLRDGVDQAYRSKTTEWVVGGSREMQSGGGKKEKEMALGWLLLE
jgi:hypothetical protein